MLSGSILVYSTKHKTKPFMTLVKKCNDWVKMIQQGAGETGSAPVSSDERFLERGRGGESEKNDDGSEDSDASHIIERDNSDSDSSSLQSDLIEEFESDSEPFLPQQFGLIEDPGVIRINNVDYGDVLDVDYGEIISFKQSKSFIDNLHHRYDNWESRHGVLRLSKSLNDVTQDCDDDDICFHSLNLSR